MIRVKMMRKNETCIIDNGKTYLFGSNGSCIQEDAGNLSQHMSNALDLPLISILSCNGYVDIGVSETGKEFKSYPCSLDSVKCAMQLQSIGKFVKMLMRSGKHPNGSFNQMIFIYPEGTNLSNHMKALNIGG